MKKILSICTVLLIVSALALPCFAVGFGELTPDVSSYAYMPLTNGQITSGDLDLYKEMVDLQTKLGFYSGAEPVAILAYRLSATQMQVAVCTVNPQTGYGEKRFSYYCDVVSGVMACSGRVNGEERFDRNTGMNRYTLCADGCFGLNYIGLKTVTVNDEDYYAWSIMWLKNYNGVWYRPSDGAAPVSPSDSVSESLQNIVNDFRTAVVGDGGTPLPVDDGNYFLDIPSIITAIPTAARNLIESAFDIEIFGINIAGLLSVVIIITLVSFLIRRLMNR